MNIPAFPGNLQVTPGDQANSVSWNASCGASTAASATPTLGPIYVSVNTGDDVNDGSLATPVKKLRDRDHGHLPRLPAQLHRRPRVGCTQAAADALRTA